MKKKMKSSSDCPFCKADNKCNNKHCIYTKYVKLPKGSKTVDISGQRFDRLVAVKYIFHEKRKRWCWECLCDCGRVTYNTTTRLTKNEVKSCGCYTRERMTKYNKERRHQTAINAMYGNYKRAATKRNIEFNITCNEFEEVAKKECAYCGGAPIRKCKRGDSEFYGNGVDRVDNNKGYTVENCLPCCSFCNSVKMDKDLEFLESHLRKMLERITILNEED